MRALVKKIAGLIRGSAWTSLFFRGVALAAALLVLAWVGRSAIASSGPPPGITNESDSGKAPAPVLLTSAIVAPPPSPASPPSPPSTIGGLSATPLADTTPTPSARATAEDPVYVNHASAEQLRRLPGVGAKRAEAIVQLRQRMGRFQRVEDLLRVKGVGRATLRKWRPLVRLDAPPAPSAPQQPSSSPDAG